MKSKTLYLLLLCHFTFFVNAQDSELIVFFENIDFGSSKVKTELAFGKLKGFNRAGFVMTYDKEAYNQDTIQYSDLKYENYSKKNEFLLLFCNGRIYWKRLDFNFEKDETKNVELVYNSLKEYVEDNYTYIKATPYTIANKAYGSDIGESMEYIIVSESDNYHMVRVTMSGNVKPLAMGSDTWVIDDFTVSIEICDLELFPLNSKDGFMTY